MVSHNSRNYPKGNSLDILILIYRPVIPLFYRRRFSW